MARAFWEAVGRTVCEEDFCKKVYSLCRDRNSAGEPVYRVSEVEELCIYLTGYGDEDTRHALSLYEVMEINAIMKADSGKFKPDDGGPGDGLVFTSETYRVGEDGGQIGLLLEVLTRVFSDYPDLLHERPFRRFIGMMCCDKAFRQLIAAAFRQSSTEKFRKILGEAHTEMDDGQVEKTWKELSKQDGDTRAWSRVVSLTEELERQAWRLTSGGEATVCSTAGNNGFEYRHYRQEDFFALANAVTSTADALSVFRSAARGIVPNGSRQLDQGSAAMDEALSLLRCLRDNEISAEATIQ